MQHSIQCANNFFIVFQNNPAPIAANHLLVLCEKIFEDFSLEILGILLEKDGTGNGKFFAYYSSLLYNFAGFLQSFSLFSIIYSISLTKAYFETSSFHTPSL
jgi:hypothetical protein